MDDRHITRTNRYDVVAVGVRFVDAVRPARTSTLPCVYCGRPVRDRQPMNASGSRSVPACRNGNCRNRKGGR